MAPAELRQKLLDAVRHGRTVHVTSKRNGETCTARGRVVSVNLTHFIISWRTGESVVPINSITALEETRGDE